MNFDEEFEKLSTGEQKEFALVCNNLMNQSFIVREYYDSRDKMIKPSTDYRFIERYYELFEYYLKFSGWTIDKDSSSGVIALRNNYDVNRFKIDREVSLVLFTLRYAYELRNSDETNNGLGTGHNIFMTTGELLKFMIEYGITLPGKKLTGRLLGRCLRFASQHNIISKVSGQYDDGNVSFYILPSITFAVDAQKITTMSEALDQLKDVYGDDFGGED